MPLTAGAMALHPLNRAVFVVDGDSQYHEEAALLVLQERHSIHDCV